MLIWSYKKLNQTLKEEINPALHKRFQKTAEEPLPRSCVRLVHSYYQNRARTVEGRKIMSPISLTNTDANLLNEKLANKINQ